MRVEVRRMEISPDVLSLLRQLLGRRSLGFVLSAESLEVPSGAVQLHGRERRFALDQFGARLRVG